jgi:hypothetical protein
MRRSEVIENRFVIKEASATGVIGAEDDPDPPESMHPARCSRAGRCIHRLGRIHLSATPCGRGQSGFDGISVVTSQTVNAEYAVEKARNTPARNLRFRAGFSTAPGAHVGLSVF